MTDGALHQGGLFAHCTDSNCFGDDKLQSHKRYAILYHDRIRAWDTADDMIEGRAPPFVMKLHGQMQVREISGLVVVGLWEDLGGHQHLSPYVAVAPGDVEQLASSQSLLRKLESAIADVRAERAVRAPAQASQRTRGKRRR